MTTPASSQKAATFEMEWIVANSFNLTLVLMAATTVFMYIMSVIHRNYSWVDRFWSILPVIFAWIHVYYKSDGKFETITDWKQYDRAAIFYASIVTVWGARLTYNFYRRGGYTRGYEDYRWNFLRSFPGLQNPVVWELYSFTNIALFQVALLWAISLPMININWAPITAKDMVIGSCMLLFILFETICDQQQYNFQKAKQQNSKKGRGSRENKDDFLSYGFCFTGTFGYSRHLNVFCEGCVWITLAVAALLHGPAGWWVYAGCITLELLTYYSTAHVTEVISGSKYPQYAIYKQTTPMLIPTLRSTTMLTLHKIKKEEKRN
ncbi:putative Protein of unknown function (DUF1295) [Trypanosoma vivax]|uniref:Steroid 5-alpha reductase C-terminal domain-containing protein n=1 Tax=Trypanosoma vivax (strain Y486) TaxID=1055687 RepID=G0UA30_TRYVY|nr:hypothetical protein TRVL_03133 [Trypanosoma vivax]KAH8619113.1 putative Protein of unknown function (DUF1295) [Trypanosoma vivax]CCC52662.1 conserved hypothetical protein [Trypanosoma vivax Y486]